MIGLTLGRYFFMRYISITFWFFLGIFALVFIINFTELSGRMSGLPGYSIDWALTVAALQVPMVMQQTVPFIGLVSGMVTLISLNRKYELVVARSAGISAWQFLAPVCAGAFMFGLAAIVVLNPIAAHGYARSQFLETEVRGARPQDGNAGNAPWIKQRTDEGETIIGARSVLAQGLELADATFLRMDLDGDIIERLDAERAYLRQGHWELRNVSRLGDGSTREKVESVSVKTNLSPEFVTERLARPETIPFFELPRKIAAARSFGLGANAFATHFHTLLALPVLLVAMTLIAATVSMRFARMGQSATIILGGILAGFLLYVVTVLVKAFGSAGFVPPVAAAWFPVIIAGFFGVTFLLYKEDG
ncbi:LPS export ABC transporter permease LptG [Aquamicrobium sp. LC103]|uniref:LPS export ABC transporter permease LptG n=1 Tax=Aquamicrobium sp. LC103 TaxID=1120658 RepID=UPI00063E7990|nr:LPS export ABC transporter permease LptG [Aquamicrobium sp. LC103]TKT81359.1 LPS export ABC transporter permease LptG [Aquamicrobium sp. LC103]